MRTSYKILNPEFPYFITSTIVNWLYIFTHEKYFDLLFNNLCFYQDKYELDIIAYVIMKNHFHLICKGRQLEKAIQSLKSYTAKLIIKELKKDKSNSVLEKLRNYKPSYKNESQYQVWQEGYHPQEMVNKYILMQKIEYIHFNPLRKGYVEKAEHWKYSSAGFYLDGRESKLRITRYD
ncbi:MAG: transposase [Ignavibacteria bacterium]